MNDRNLTLGVMKTKLECLYYFNKKKNQKKSYSEKKKTKYSEQKTE